MRVSLASQPVQAAIRRVRWLCSGLTFDDSKEVQTVEFNPCKARYVKLQALSAVIKEAKMAAVAELEVLLAE